MKVIEEIHFDDDDVAPEGVSYVGVDRRIANGDEEFFVRSYSDDAQRAIIMSPDDALRSGTSRALVEFLSEKMGYTQFEFPCSETGLFEEIDKNTMSFIYATGEA